MTENGLDILGYNDWVHNTGYESHHDGFSFVRVIEVNKTAI